MLEYEKKECLNCDESNLGNVPNDLGVFLSENPNGIFFIREAYFPLISEEDAIIIKIIGGSNSEYQFDIQSMTLIILDEEREKLLRDHNLNPDKILVLTRDVFGNPVYISLNEDSTYGCIYYEYYEQLIFISKNFDEFLSKLITEDEFNNLN